MYQKSLHFSIIYETYRELLYVFEAYTLHMVSFNYISSPKDFRVMVSCVLKHHNWQIMIFHSWMFSRAKRSNTKWLNLFWSVWSDIVVIPLNFQILSAVSSALWLYLKWQEAKDLSFHPSKERKTAEYLNSNKSPNTNQNTRPCLKKRICSSRIKMKENKNLSKLQDIATELKKTV